MSASVVLVEAYPRLASDGAEVRVLLAGLGGERPYFYQGEHWRAGLTALPRSVARLDHDGLALGGGGVADAFELVWAPAGKAALADVAALVWNDAPIAVYVGPEGDALPPMATSGLVLDTAIEGGALTIAMADGAVDLKRPLLVDRFGGAGGLDGPADWAGQIRTRCWGRCFNVPGKLLDRANQIWCFGDPMRSWQAFAQVRDKGVAATAVGALAWQGSAAATFAALQAAAAPEGGCVVCPSIACVKWWAEPAGDLYADVLGETAGGYVETAPEIVARIVAARSTLGFGAGELARAIAARPAPFGWRVASDSATAAGELSELLGGVSLSWLVVDGAIVLRAWDWTASTRVAQSHKVTRRQVYKPVATVKLGYRRNWSPMQRSDIAASVLATDIAYEDGTPIDALRPAEGGANVTETRTARYFLGQGALATLSSLANGGPYLSGFGLLSQRNYIKIGGPDIGGDSFALLTAEGGTTSNGSIITALGTALYLAGQGPFATASGGQSLDGSLFTMPTRLLPFAGDSNFLVASRVAWDGGNTVEAYKPGERGANVTENRTALYVAGQGALATLSALANGGPYLTGFGLLSQRNYIKIGGPDIGGDSFALLTAEGGTTSNGSIITALGTALYLAGQGPFATASGGQSLDGSLFTMPTRLLPFAGDSNYLVATRVAWADGNTVEAFRPQEPGANVTENRTARYLTGQGALATLSQLALGSGYLSGFGALAAATFVQFGASSTVRREDGSSVTDTMVVTAFGTAAYIFGQGSLATKNQTNTADIVPQAVNRAIANETSTTLDVPWNRPRSNPVVGLSLTISNPTGAMVRIDTDLAFFAISYTPPGTATIVLYGRLVRIQSGVLTEVWPWQIVPFGFARKLFLDTPAATADATYRWEFATEDPDQRTNVWQVTNQLMVLTEIKR
ncbi:hypothetical protein [uncultured Sphingomonas sp.]|uniref:hypothetical protein n=1 Tax=uncultured Sphingomonas sp. TaxID=158754 RepID=UPI002586A2C7|nr:hypothetical protein [uncultured Sphingomonas sp.]